MCAAECVDVYRILTHSMHCDVVTYLVCVLTCTVKKQKAILAEDEDAADAVR